MKIKKEILYAALINFVLLVSGVYLGVSGRFLLVICVWVFLIFYALENIKDRSMLFAFLIAFFVFLLGRDFLQQFFKYQVENFSENTQRYAYNAYLISLLTVGIGYYFFSSRKKHVAQYHTAHNSNRNYLLLVRQLSLYLYYITWIFAVISKFLVGTFVASRGITDYYTDYSEYLIGNSFYYLISKIELMMPVVWCIYLASCPSKKKLKWPLILYVFYLVISLGSGQRSTFMLGILFLFIYFMYRQGLNPEEVWVTRKIIFLGVLSLPLLAVFGSFYSIWREGGDLATMNMAKGFIEFFYDQGVTSNVMKRAYIYKDQIPSNQIYVLEFLHSGILARLLGIPVYHGNNIEHAMYGGSFTHTLGYVVMGNAYLAGRGTGTCYISELYQDMGYVGILLGNIIYAYLIAKIANKQDDKTLFLSSVRFMIITQLLWAPRGSFTGFITQNIAPTTLVVFVMVFGMSKLIVSVKSKTKMKRIR